MSEILLTTLNARYVHSAFGLRYLYANLGALQSRAKIMEFDISKRPQDILETILLEKPVILGIGVYIWNTRQVTDLLSLLRRVAPEIKVILGGPEISFEAESQPLFSLCDYIIQGEADLEFARICAEILNGSLPEKKIISAPLPATAAIKYPYDQYTDADIANRVIYVEASRGCPFTCEFCLSSLEVPVRQFELESFLTEMDKLIERGVKQFKFVDRTFNLHLKTSKTILEFFLSRYKPGLFVHFEMVPDRLPEALREIIAHFPQSSLQFEVGIQSFNPEVGKLISRRQDFNKIADNIRFLRANTGVHIHADLIVGLPGEDLQSFADGFNTLVELDPQEIQIGILKRLRGTPIVRHDETWEMTYSNYAPYELLSNKLMDYATMQRMGRFSRYWDIISNSGNFSKTRTLLWQRASSPFNGFMAWSDWLYKKTGSRHAFSLHNLERFLTQYLVEEVGFDVCAVTESLALDRVRIKSTALPDRQARHAVGA